MVWIKFPAALLPGAVFFYFLNHGSEAVLGAPLPDVIKQTWSAGSTDILFALSIIAVLYGIFLGIVGLMFGDWAVRATARHGGLRCCLFLGETYSSTRYYIENLHPHDRQVSENTLLIVKAATGTIAAPKAQSFRQLFRYHLLDEEGSRLEGREIGLQRAVERLIISPVTLWLIFLFAGLAFLPSLTFEVLRAPGGGATGFPLVLEPPYTDRVLLPAMPELAIAFAFSVALGGAALWRRHRLMSRFQETHPNFDTKPRVQSGEILEGRIIERVWIDPGWYHSPHVGYSVRIDGRFEAPVVIGFSVASSPDCPLFRSLEHAVAENTPVRVWIDPDAKVRPFMEPLPGFLDCALPIGVGERGPRSPHPEFR